MSRKLLWRFILRDVYLSRWMTTGGVLSALAALALVKAGTIGAYAALLFMIVAGVGPGIFIAVFLIAGERKERAYLFSLSLPISGPQYGLAKLTAGCLTYLLPWILLAVAVFALTGLLSLPQGFLPVGMMVWVFLLDLFCMMLAITLTTQSEALTIAGVAFCNTSISFYFYVVLHVPGVAAHVGGTTAVWSPAVIQILALQFAIAVALIAITLWRLFRQRDFV